MTPPPGEEMEVKVRTDFVLKWDYPEKGTVSPFSKSSLAYAPVQPRLSPES